LFGVLQRLEESFGLHQRTGAFARNCHCPHRLQTQASTRKYQGRAMLVFAREHQYCQASTSSAFIVLCAMWPLLRCSGTHTNCIGRSPHELWCPVPVQVLNGARPDILRLHLARVAELWLLVVSDDYPRVRVELLK
jgi:hypothetical protein